MQTTEKLLAITELQSRIKPKTSFDFDTYLDIVNVLKEVSDSERSSFFIYDDKQNKLETQVNEEMLTKISLNPDKGLVGRCFIEKMALIENDVDTNKDFHPTIDVSSGFVTRNTLVVPILDVNQKAIGVLQVLNKVNALYAEKDEKLLISIAELASDYMQRTLSKS